MKKIYYVLFVAFFALAATNTNAQLTGAGTSEGDPYLITSSADLVELYTDQSYWGGGKFFKQTVDIDMAGIEFKPIGYVKSDGGVVKVSFYGSYDGDGKLISNLTVTPYADHHVTALGMFGSTNGAKIKNVGLININIDRKDATIAKERVGALVGRMEPNAGNLITNCFVSGGTVTGSNRTGGLIGQMNSGTVTDCFSNVFVDSPSLCGGVIGDLLNGTITNIISYGNITGGSTAKDVVAGNNINAGATLTNLLFANNNRGDENATQITGGLDLEASYSGYNFTDTWEISGTMGYAVLKGFSVYDIPLAIEEEGLATNSAKIFNVGSTLYINQVAPQVKDYKVYDISGVLVQSGLLQNEVNLELSKGIYIVKVGTATVKIKL